MLVLFDIDGTILLSSGAGARAMVEAGRELFGPRFTFEGVDIAGRLDPLIWADAMAAGGLETGEERHARFRARYAEILAANLAAGASVRILPGVRELIARLAGADVTVGLLTGNYPETGRLKLEAGGLDVGDFPVAAWGSDGAHRRDLPLVAIDRYRAHAARDVHPARVVVVGDTPHDVDCARVCGCRSIAVATGPRYDLDDLVAAGPDLALADLSATDAVTGWVLDACAEAAN